MKFDTENPNSHKTKETREIIEYALKTASLYKYQKVLLMVEIIGKLTDGEYSHGN